jgi:hypothetical protein
MKRKCLLLIGIIAYVGILEAQTSLVEWDFQDSDKQTACMASKVYLADQQINNATAEINFSNLQSWTNNKGETLSGFNEFAQLTTETTDGDFLVSTRGWTIENSFFQLDNLNTSGNNNVSIVFDTYTQTTKSYRNWKVEYQLNGTSTWESFDGNTWDLVADDVITEIPIERVNHVIDLPAVLQNSASLFSLRILPVSGSPSIDPSKSNNNLAWTKFDNIKLVGEPVPTAVQSFSAEEIVVYPTVVGPGQEITVQFPNTSSAIVSFYSITGQLHKEVVCHSNTSIQSTGLESGIYVFKVDLGTTAKTGKIVIK